MVWLRGLAQVLGDLGALPRHRRSAVRGLRVLPAESILGLGQLAPGVDPEGLEVGMEMELVLGTLYEDEDNEYVVWKWQPAAA